MNVAIIGYGKMGKTIEGLSNQMNFTVTQKFDEHNPFVNCSEINADVAIDFTTPSLAVKHIYHAINLNIPIVVGTTGWYDSFNEVCDYVHKNNGSLFYATNFSLGVNLFFQLTEKFTKLLNPHKDYNATLVEIHHTEKLDAPSGTAITMAEKVINHSTQYENFELMENNQFPQYNSTLPITAIREHNVPGTHSLKFESDVDYIEIKHEAKGRLGFAKGSVLAARYIIGKKGVYTMTDLIN